METTRVRNVQCIYHRGFSGPPRRSSIERGTSNGVREGCFQPHYRKSAPSKAQRTSSRLSRDVPRTRKLEHHVQPKTFRRSLCRGHSFERLRNGESIEP